MRLQSLLISSILFAMPVAAQAQDSDAAVVAACLKLFADGPRLIAENRADRFQGKPGEAALRCRGGEKAVARRNVPWVDWSNYWGTGDAASKSDKKDVLPLPPLSRHLFDRNTRGIDGTLTDMEYQRMELIKFNLLHNATFEQYVRGRKVGKEQVEGPLLRVWPEMRLPPSHPNFRDLQVLANGDQQCKGALIRFRTVSGICNDTRNPAMGSAGQLFARNVQFESTYPDLGLDPLAKNRHGDRLGLLKPDPQVISRRLFTRDQSSAPDCNKGLGTPGKDSTCAYKPAPFFNVMAAFWIQFMTHDWFTHLDQARNDRSTIMSVGCASERVNNVEQPISAARAAELGCRPADKMEAALIADKPPAGTFKFENATYPKRSPKTSRNMNTAWWDASQIYGYDDNSRRRMRRDPNDAAKLQLINERSG